MYLDFWAFEDIRFEDLGDSYHLIFEKHSFSKGHSDFFLWLEVIM